MTVHVAFLDPLHPAIVSTARAAMPDGWEATFAGQRPAEQAEALSNAEVAFVLAAPVNAELLAQAPELKLIQKMGAGVDRLDLDVCAQRGIAVARLAGGNAVPVAEHTILLMLAAFRQLPDLDRRTRAGEWLKEEARGTNRHLLGKRVGIVGFGAIGRELATRLRAFGVELVYYDPVVDASTVEVAFGVRAMDLDELLASSDVVTLHVPLLPETRGMINEARLRSMKPDALLVNAARGGLVDEAALARVLEEGHLLGAAIDTFEHEPPVGSPLLTSERTVVTPHVAGATLDNFASVIAHAVANAEGYLRGEGLPREDAVLVPEGAAVTG